MARTATSSNSSSRNNSSGIGGVFPAMIEPARAEVIFNDLPQLLSFPLQRAKALAKGKEGGITLSEAKGFANIDELQLDQKGLPRFASEVLNGQMSDLNAMANEYQNNVTSQLAGQDNDQLPNVMNSLKFYETSSEFIKESKKIDNTAEQVAKVFNPFDEKVQTDPSFAGDVAFGNDFRPLEIELKDANGNTHFVNGTNELLRYSIDNYYDPRNGVQALQVTAPTNYKGFNELFEKRMGSATTDDVNFLLKYIKGNESVPSINPNNSSYSTSEIDNYEIISKLNRKGIGAYFDKGEAFIKSGEWKDPSYALENNEESLIRSYGDFIDEVHNDPELRMVYEKRRNSFFQQFLDLGIMPTFNDNGEMMYDKDGKPITEPIDPELVGARADKIIFKEYDFLNGNGRTENEINTLKDKAAEVYKSLDASFSADLVSQKLKAKQAITGRYEVSNSLTYNVAAATPEDLTKNWWNEVLSPSNYEYFPYEEWLSMSQDYSVHINGYPDVKSLRVMAESVGLPNMYIDVNGNPTEKSEGNKAWGDAYADWTDELIEQEKSGNITDPILTQALGLVSGYASARGKNEDLYKILNDDEEALTEYGRSLRSALSGMYLASKMEKMDAPEKMWEYAKQNASTHSGWREINPIFHQRNPAVREHYSELAKSGKPEIFEEDGRIQWAEKDESGKTRVYEFKKKDYENLISATANNGAIWTKSRIFAPSSTEVEAQLIQMFKNPQQNTTYNIGGHIVKAPPRSTGADGFITGLASEVVGVKGATRMAPFEISKGEYKFMPAAFVEYKISGEQRDKYQVPVIDRDKGGVVYKEISKLKDWEKEAIGLVEGNKGFDKNSNEIAPFYTLTLQVTLQQLQSNQLLSDNDFLNKFGEAINNVSTGNVVPYRTKEEIEAEQQK